MKKFLGFWILWVIVGVCLIAFPVVTSGLSFLFCPVVDSLEDVEALYSTDGEYRPFAEFRFETVIFSGLYLCVGEDDTPTDWVMCGYIDGRFLPFYVRATSSEPPDDLTNVSYILRRPSDVNTVHDEWVVTSLIDDIVNESEYEYDEASTFFTTEVLQADRNGAIILKVCAVAGLLLIAVGVLFLVLRLKRAGRSAPPTAQTGGEEPLPVAVSAVSDNSPPAGEVPGSDDTSASEDGSSSADDYFGFKPF